MNWIQKWQLWLNSLATPGGAIFILLSMIGAADIGSFTLYLRHDMGVGALATVVSLSGPIGGALLLALKSSIDHTPPAPVIQSPNQPSPSHTSSDFVGPNAP